MVTWKDRHRLVTAVYALVRKDDKILLMRRFNTGYMDGKYSLPSGHVEKDESARSSMVREIEEEIGLSVKPEDLEFIHLANCQSENRDHQRIHIYFRLNNWTGGIINAEPDKCDELIWRNLDDLPPNLADEVDFALKLIKDEKLYSEYNF